MLHFLQGFWAQADFWGAFIDNLIPVGIGFVGGSWFAISSQSKDKE